MSNSQSLPEPEYIKVLDLLFLRPGRVALFAGPWAALGYATAIWAALSSGNDPEAPQILDRHDARVLAISATSFIFITLWLALASWKSKSSYSAGFILAGILMLVVPAVMDNWIELVDFRRFQEASYRGSITGPKAFLGPTLLGLGIVVFLFRGAYLGVYKFRNSEKYKRNTTPDHTPSSHSKDEETYLYPSLGTLDKLGLPRRRQDEH